MRHSCRICRQSGVRVCLIENILKDFAMLLNLRARVRCTRSRGLATFLEHCLAIFAVVLGLCLSPFAGVRADEVADFYHSHPVSLITGFGPGGGYDVYARLLARHIGRYIPGNPSVVVQNMPGAGSLRAANYIYSVAPKDGTAFGLFSRG